ncbi:MAG TPA: hypothetical protein VL691_16330 [Vicinamibacteria bacterium]|nr:hypothetical protein [Vicinamibacteria bacterium]
MSRARTALLAFTPLLLHVLAREADRGLGLVLRAGIEPDGLLAEVARAAKADASSAAFRVSAGALLGLALWGALAWWRRHEGAGWEEALASEAQVLLPLLLRPALTVVALVSVAIRPAYPYAFTLPVALTQDWGPGQDAATLATCLALRLPRLRLPGPRPLEVFALSFLAYAALVPGWAWRWEGHPGNEPKYLRQAVALGHGLTFDAEGVSASMEELPTRPLAESLPAAVATLARESARMAAALGRGEAGRDAIRATRITRQTIRGKEGGVYYVLAPGPSLLLAPALRLDRALNLARGVPGRLAASVLTWCALAALLVTAVFCLVRDATGRPGLAAAIAFGFALVPPFLFYFFQFYPEMPGALVLAVAFRALALRPEGFLRHSWRFGLMLGTLPWLHQKFLPVWLVLVATSLWLSFRVSDRLRVALGLLVPTAASLCLIALDNFAITGSVRPDALFLAWGPSGVMLAHMPRGALGLLLDARYGILPFVPILILAAAGLVHGGARRFAVVLPAATVYYLTVASADNWAGAVCNLGRYVMPLTPLAVALVGLSFRGAPVEPGAEESTVQSRSPGMTRRGVLAFVLMLAAWTGLFAVALWRDPQAANDSALLLAKSIYADGDQYIPSIPIRHWSDAAPEPWTRVAAWLTPGLSVRIAVWLAALAATALWLRRVASAAPSDRRATSPTATLAAVAALVLSAGILLERWPGERQALVFPGAITLSGSVPGSAAETAPPVLFLSGAARVREGEAVVGPGKVDVLVRAPQALDTLRATVGGPGGVLRVRGLPPLALRPTGALLDLPLVPYHEVRGREGRRVVYSRARLDFEGEAVLRFDASTAMQPPSPAPVPDVPEGEMEPDAVPDR